MVSNAHGGAPSHRRRPAFAPCNVWYSALEYSSTLCVYTLQRGACSSDIRPASRGPVARQRRPYQLQRQRHELCDRQLHLHRDWPLPLRGVYVCVICMFTRSQATTAERSTPQLRRRTVVNNCPMQTRPQGSEEEITAEEWERQHMVRTPRIRTLSRQRLVHIQGVSALH